MDGPTQHDFLSFSSLAHPHPKNPSRHTRAIALDPTPSAAASLATTSSARTRPRLESGEPHNDAGRAPPQLHPAPLRRAAERGGDEFTTSPSSSPSVSTKPTPNPTRGRRPGPEVVWYN